jgi:hypothetical protein
MPQIQRIIRKTDLLVESGKQMVVDSKEAARQLREAEWEARRTAQSQRHPSLLARFWKLIFH